MHALHIKHNPLVLQWLTSNHQVHRSEKILLSTSDQHISSKSQVVGRLVGSWWCDTDLLQSPDELVNQAASDLGHSGNGWEIPDRLHVLEVASNWEVPWSGILGSLGEILVVLEDEASSLDGTETLRDADHVGDTVALLDTETNLTVTDVVDVVLVGHEPLVDTEDSAWLQNVEDLGIDTLERLCVDGSLNGIDGIEGLWCESHLHEITLDEGQLVGEVLLLCVAGCTLNLVIVVVQAGNVSTGELGDLSSWSTNTAANIQNLHALLDTDVVSEVVLVASNGLVEWLAECEAAEVERLAPSVLVQVGSKVVVMLGESCVLLLSCLCGKLVNAHAGTWNGATYLSDLLGLVGSSLVVPMFEVLINCDLLRSVVLVHPCLESSLLLRGLSVHGPHEVLVLGMVLLLESRGNRRHIGWFACFVRYSKFIKGCMLN